MSGPEFIDIPARRVLSAEEASALVGERIPDDLEPSFRSPRPGQIVRLIDVDTAELVGMVTRLERGETSRLRRTVTGMKMAATGRQGTKLENSGRTFGWAPKRPMIRRETCTPTSLAVDAPDANAYLADLGGWLGREFRRLAPSVAEHDESILEQVHKDWRLEEEALWTSGVVNKTSQLPYHRDSTNFPTWSAMPTLRQRMKGGHLHLPEYDVTFPCGDGDVSWFCGKELVHGVTPMWLKDKQDAEAYRYSVVFYALAGMKNCRTVAEETADAASRRTAREREMAKRAREALAAARAK